MKNNLISLIGQTYHGANTYFGSQKWMDFIETYWHVECPQDVFKRFYRPLSEVVQPQEVQLQQIKSRRNLWKSKGTPSRTSNGNFTKRIIKQAIGQLNATAQTVERLRALMNETFSKLHISSCYGNEGCRTASGALAYGRNRRCHKFYP